MYRWALIKRLFVKRLTRLALKRDYNVDYMKQLIIDVCVNLPDHQVDNIINQNASYIDQYRLRNDGD